MNKAKFGPMLLALALFAVFLLIQTRFLLPLLSIVIGFLSKESK